MARALNTLVSQLNLRNRVTVIDIGGYKGEFAKEVVDQYNAQVRIYEPKRSWAEAIEKRFEDNAEVDVIPCGVGDSTREDTLYVNKDGSSLYKKFAKSERVEIVKASEYLPESAHLLKINCEGSEYEIIDDLDLTRYEKILVQFHEKDDLSYERAQTKLKKTHTEIGDKRWKWELWERLPKESWQQFLPTP